MEVAGKDGEDGVVVEHGGVPCGTGTGGEEPGAAVVAGVGFVGAAVRVLEVGLVGEDEERAFASGLRCVYEGDGFLDGVSFFGGPGAGAVVAEVFAVRLAAGGSSSLFGKGRLVDGGAVVVVVLGLEAGAVEADEGVSAGLFDGLASEVEDAAGD